MLHFHLKACSKCQGDLALDEGDWLCLQCGTYYYTRLYRTPVVSPTLVPEPARRVQDPSGDQRVKTASLPNSAVPGISQFPDLSTTVSGFGETTSIGFGAIWIGGRDRSWL